MVDNIITWSIPLNFNKGAFTNDVIILGGRGFENMTQNDVGRGCRAKDGVTFFDALLEKFQAILF